MRDTTPLGILAAVLAGVLGLEVWPRADEPAPAPATPVQVANRQARATPDARGGAVMALARPLFSATRRPPSADAAEEAKAPAPDRLPRLMGVVIAGGAKTVLFAAPGGGRPVTVAEGGTLNGFTVRAVEPGGVTVVSAAGTRVLRPSFDANAEPPISAQGLAPGLAPQPLMGVFRAPGSAPPGFSQPLAGQPFNGQPTGIPQPGVPAAPQYQARERDR